MTSPPPKKTQSQWFLCPVIVWGYWRPALTQWSKETSSFLVFTHSIQGYDTDTVPNWLVPLGKKNKLKHQSYYPTVNDWYPTPWLCLLKAFIAFSPQSIACYGFSGWTLFAVFLKKLGLVSYVSILLEGSSPGVDLKRDLIRTFFRKMMVKIADDCFSQTDEGIEYLKRLGARSPKLKTWLLPDSERIPKKVHKSHARGVIRFLMVGTLEKRKGVDFILQVFNQLKAPWELTLIGEKIDAPERSISLPSQSQIKVLGSRPYRDLLKELCEYDIFLFPTREDTWGMAPLEAACAGLPIIASPYFGSKRLLTHATILPLEESLWVSELNKVFSESDRSHFPAPKTLLPPISSLFPIYPHQK